MRPANLSGVGTKPPANDERAFGPTQVTGGWERVTCAVSVSVLVAVAWACGVTDAGAGAEAGAGKEAVGEGGAGAGTEAVAEGDGGAPGFDRGLRRQRRTASYPWAMATRASSMPSYPSG